MKIPLSPCLFGRASMLRVYVVLVWNIKNACIFRFQITMGKVAIYIEGRAKQTNRTITANVCKSYDGPLSFENCEAFSFIRAQ